MTPSDLSSVYATKDLDMIVEALKDQNRKLEARLHLLENEQKESDQLRKENAQLKSEIQQLNAAFVRAQILEHHLLEKRNVDRIVEIYKKDLEAWGATLKTKQKTPTPSV